VEAIAHRRLASRRLRWWQLRGKTGREWFHAGGSPGLAPIIAAIEAAAGDVRRKAMKRGRWHPGDDARPRAWRPGAGRVPLFVPGRCYGVAGPIV
jgi:hypothetical protein